MILGKDHVDKFPESMFSKTVFYVALTSNILRAKAYVYNNFP